MLTCWLDDGGNQVCQDLQRYDEFGQPVGRAPGSDPGAEAMQAAYPNSQIIPLGPDASGNPAYAAYDTSTGTGAGSLSVPDLTAGLSEAEAWRRIREINPTFIDHDLPILLSNAPSGSVSGLGLLNSYLLANNPVYIAAGLPMPWNLLDNAQAASLHAGSSWWEKFSGRTLVPTVRYGLLAGGLALSGANYFGYLDPAPVAGAGDVGTISGDVGNDTLAGGADLDMLDASAAGDVDEISGDVGNDTLADGADSNVPDNPAGGDGSAVPATPYTLAQPGDLIHNPATHLAPAGDVGTATSGLTAHEALAVGKTSLGLASLMRGLLGGDPAPARRLSPLAAARPASLVASPKPSAGGGSIGGWRGDWAAADGQPGGDMGTADEGLDLAAGLALAAGFYVLTSR